MSCSLPSAFQQMAWCWNRGLSGVCECRHESRMPTCPKKTFWTLDKLTASLFCPHLPARLWPVLTSGTAPTCAWGGAAPIHSGLESLFSAHRIFLEQSFRSVMVARPWSDDLK